MTVDRLGGASPQRRGGAGVEGSSAILPQAPEIPRRFQLLFGLYILLTGSIPTIVQAIAFGLPGGGGTEFVAAMLTESARDFLLIVPLLILSKHPLGILHPLLIAVVVWPELSTIPSVVNDYGGWAGIVAGTPVETPYFVGLRSREAGYIWMAIAKYNSLEIARLLAIYFGFSLLTVSEGFSHTFAALRRPSSVRAVMIGLIALSALVLLAFIESRGGLIEHLASLGHGRFRELGGEGIVMVAIDLGAIAIYVWAASSPDDLKNPAFLGSLAIVVAAQFLSNGSRSGAIEVPMTVGLVWALRTQKVPWRIALLLLPVFFLSLGLMNAIRTSSWSGRTAGDVIEKASLAQSFAIAEQEIARRRSLIAEVPIVERGFDRTGGPMLGRSYIAAVVAPVPRKLWASKPRGPDSLYAQVFLGEPRQGQGIPITETAEEYWNFGLVGVLLLSAIYGWLLKRVYYSFCWRYPNPIAIVFYALFVTTFHFSTEDIVSLEQKVALLMVCAASVSIFAPRPRERFTYPARTGASPPVARAGSVAK